MNSLNAALFIALGAAMDALPHVMPAWFPRHSPDESSASALWMASMGLLQVLIGLSHFARTFVLPLVGRIAMAIPVAGDPAMPVAQHAPGR